MLLDLSDKVVIVTGAGRGIGRVITERFLAESARVVTLDLDAGGLDWLSGHDPDTALGLSADVSDSSAVARAIEQVLDRFGRLDVLVNNAGIERKAPFWEVTEQDYDAVMAVNCKGLFFASQAATRHWLASKRPGCIINISSVH